MRTAQSVPSTTTRRPVAKCVPLTYRSIGVVGLLVELDDRAGRQADHLRRTASARGRARPRRGPGCRPATASRRWSRARRALAGVSGGAGDLGADARRARSSCAPRTRSGRAARAGAGSPQTGIAIADRVRRRAGRRPRSSSADVNVFVSGVPISTSVPSTDRRRGRGRGHHLVHGLRDGRELELGELGRVRVLGLVHAHHRRRRALRAPSSVIRNTLPPVTPST